MNRDQARSTQMFLQALALSCALQFGPTSEPESPEAPDAGAEQRVEFAFTAKLSAPVELPEGETPHVVLRYRRGKSWRGATGDVQTREDGSIHVAFDSLTFDWEPPPCLTFHWAPGGRPPYSTHDEREPIWGDRRDVTRADWKAHLRQAAGEPLPLGEIELGLAPVVFEASLDGLQGESLPIECWDAFPPNTGGVLSMSAPDFSGALRSGETLVVRSWDPSPIIRPFRWWISLTHPDARPYRSRAALEDAVADRPRRVFKSYWGPWGRKMELRAQDNHSIELRIDPRGLPESGFWRLESRRTYRERRLVATEFSSSMAHCGVLRYERERPTWCYREPHDRYWDPHEMMTAARLHSRTRFALGIDSGAHVLEIWPTRTPPDGRPCMTFEIDVQGDGTWHVKRGEEPRFEPFPGAED